MTSHFLSTQPINVQRSCRNYELVKDIKEIEKGDQIRYFSKDRIPQFRMGGTVTRVAPLFIEVKRGKKNYVISIHKYTFFIKKHVVKRSKQHKLMKALLDSIT